MKRGTDYATAFMCLIAPLLAWSDCPRQPGLTVTTDRASTAILSQANNATLAEKNYQLGASSSCWSFGAWDLQTGLDYQYTRYLYQGVVSRDRDLHRLQIPLRLQRRQGGWRYQLNVHPGLATSSNVSGDLFGRAGREDLFATGSLEVHHAAAKRPSYFGIGYSRLFGDPSWYPVGGVTLQGERAWSARLGFPLSAVSFKPSGRWQLVTRVYPGGARWHVVSDDFTSDFAYRVKTLRAEAIWRITIAGRWQLDFITGRDFAREHQFVNALGNPIDTEVGGEWRWGIGLSMGAAAPLQSHGVGL